MFCVLTGMLSTGMLSCCQHPSDSMAMYPLVHIHLICGYAPHRLLPRSSLRAHPTFISCFAMSQNEPVMSDDNDECWTTGSEGASPTPEDNESDSINEIEHARKALASCPPDHPDQAEGATSLGDNDHTNVMTGRNSRHRVSIFAEKPLGRTQRANFRGEG
jgi:hypothetical protein